MEKQFRVEWCGSVEVYVPVKDTDPKEWPVFETTPPNAFLKSIG